MADNVDISAGSGTTVATDDVGGVHYQRVKVDLGGDGAASPLVRGQQAAADSLPVVLASDQTLALPSGAATAAKQDTGNTALAAIQTAVEVIDNAIAGTEMQVDVVGSLPAGTNAIGKLAANSGVDIGDVDVTSVPADPFGVNADAAATAGGTGSMQAKFRLMTSQLDSIKTAVETLDNTVGGSELQVDVVGALPAGTNNIGDVDVASIAAGDNNIGNVDIVTVPADPFGANADAASATGSISAKLRFIAGTGIPITGTVTVDGSGVTQPVSHAALTELAAAINASSQMDVNIAASGATVPVSNAGLTALNGAISGTEVQVDVVGALPAGANAIGKLAANSGVDIGDVDVTSIIPGTGATNLGKAEDAAHASADVGVQILAVRKATPVTLSDTDGDYEPIQISIGHVWVAPPPVTKASTNFNRPADTTAYAANDAVNDNATAGGGSSTELSWSIGRSAGIIRRVRIKKSDQTVATPTIRLWLYDTVFASGAGDNEAFVHPATDSIGYVDVPVTTAGSDDAVGWSDCDIPFTGATLYGQLQTLSAFTPASAETFTIDFWYLPG